MTVKESKKPSKTASRRPNAGNMEKWLLRGDAYFLSLVDPFTFTGARIPDFESYPSCTFQIVKRFSVSANAAGIAGFVAGLCPVPSSTATGWLTPIRTGSGGTTTYGEVGMYTNTSSTTGGLFTGGTSSQFVFLDNYKWTSSVATGVPSYFSKVRLVSAGLAAEYLSAPLNAGGMFTVASVPYNTLRPNAGVGISLDQVQALPGSQIIPINDLEGALCTYKPVDTKALQYMDVASIQYDASTAATQANLTPAMGNEMYIIGTGMNSGDTVEFTLVLNYEAIPLSNQMNIFTGSPSPVDPQALGSVLTAIQATPNVHVGQKLVSGLPANGINHVGRSDQAKAVKQSLVGGAKNLLSTLPSQRSWLSKTSDWITSGQALNDIGNAVQTYGPIVEMAAAALL